MSRKPTTRPGRHLRLLLLRQLHRRPPLRQRQRPRRQPRPPNNPPRRPRRRKTSRHFQKGATIRFMRFLRLYSRVLEQLGPDSRLGLMLAFANVALAVAQFAEI